MKDTFIILFCLFTGLLFGQNKGKSNVSGYNVISFTYKHNSFLTAYFELQDRSVENFFLPDYYELKGGLGYKIFPKNQVFAGVGKYGTYRNSVINQNEFRIWLQHTYSTNIFRIGKADHRIRLEKRFFTYPKTGSKENTERYRYRFSITMPLNGRKIQEGSFYTNIYEEGFFGPKGNLVKRNRLFGGIGYQISEHANVNSGYIWQRDFSNSGNRNLHFLYFAVNFTFDRNEEKLKDDIQMPD